MPELQVPRTNLGFPPICVLTGETNDVLAHEVVLDKRGGAFVWGAVGLVLLGWIGEQIISHQVLARFPTTLPFSRRAYDRWRRAQGAVYGAVVVSVLLIVMAVKIFLDWQVPFLVSPSRMTAWVLLLAGLLTPALVYRLLLWNKQPCYCHTQGLVVTLWIPSSAAAEAIRSHMKPLIERATRRTTEGKTTAVGDGP
jgi:hypothetical protein